MSTWTRGTSGPLVEAYQAHLLALGYDLPRSTRPDGTLDGVVGPEVLAVTETHIAANFARGGDASHVYDVRTIPEWIRLYVGEAAAALHAPAPAPRNTGLTHIGAWGGSSALRKSTWRSYLDLALKSGLTEVSLMLNDCTGRMKGGKWRERLDFHLFQPEAQIVHVVRAYRASGLRVTLTSWLRPDLSFLDRMFDALLSIQDKSGADRLEGDAEEPYTTSRFGDHDACAEYIGQRVQDARCPWGITAIVYHHKGIIGPLVRQANFTRLQAYATRRQTAKHLLPGAIVDTAYRLHRERYGIELAKQMEPAVAFYDRAGAGGLSAAGAVRADLQAIDRNPHTSATCGWSLAALRQQPAIQAELRRWRDRIDMVKEAA